MTRRKRRALLVLTAASAAVAAMFASLPSRYAAHREWKKGLAAAAAGDVEAAEAAFKRCAAIRPSDEACAAVHEVAFLASRANGTDLGWRRPASPGAAPTEEDKKRAILHWNESIKAFQKGDAAAVRDEWLLCRKFDSGNDECGAGLARVDSSYGGGR